MGWKGMPLSVTSRARARCKASFIRVYRMQIAQGVSPGFNQRETTCQSLVSCSHLKEQMNDERVLDREETGQAKECKSLVISLS